MELYEPILSSLQSKLNGIDGEISALKERVSTVETGVAEAKAAIEENTAAIDEANGRITALKGTVEEQGQAITAIQGKINAIQQDIVKINGALNLLNQKGAKRLTSLTLMPQAYVGGIPTIEFYTASYKLMVAGEDGIYEAAAADTKPVNVDGQNTTVLYRLNPTGVTTSDVNLAHISFVQLIATARSEEPKPVAEVKAQTAMIKDSVLTVTAKKADGLTTSVDNAGNGKIYTVALRVPIAEKNYYTWTDEDGNEVVLNNTYLKVIKPIIAVVPGAIKPIEQSNVTQTRDLGEDLKVTDAYKETFNQSTEHGAKLWDYYNISAVVWDTNPDNLKVYDVKDDENTARSLEALNMTAMVTADGHFSYNGNGFVLQHTVYIKVPVTVKHEWGQLDSYVYVQIDPKK